MKKYKCTRRYFSYDFLIEKHKFNGNYITILQQIYEWMFSDNPPKNFEDEITGDVYFYISQSYLSRMNAGICSRPYIVKMFNYFKEIGLIIDTKALNNHKENYVAFDWNVVRQTLLEDEQINMKYSNNWFDRINAFADKQIAKQQQNDNSYNKTSEVNKVAGLLDDEEMRVAKPKYCKQADAIAKKILNKYGQYFVTRFPKDGEEPTKTYINLCRKIESIYGGRFIRDYTVEENVYNNKQFDTEGWQDKIKAVKNDWTKTKQLIFQAVENFVLMYDEDRMPMKKDYLTNNLNDWFFSDNLNNKGQSQFIQSLNEPMIVKQKLSLDKAKVIVEEIKSKSPVSYYAGHELNELLPVNANEASAWTLIQDIIKWGKLLFQFDENAKYFFQCEINEKLESGPKVLPALFARYLKENNISVSLNTLNIKQSIDSNAPWCWFINEACKKHNLNPDCVQCLDDADFFDAYNKGITFDEMEEIVF